MTDRNGQLVARRALMPEDYIYKNDTLNKIGPRELKPVTIKFDPLVLKKIKMLAKKRGISYNAYIRYLLAKSIEAEMIHKSLR